jgi:rod shape-determining protein MreC
MQFRPAPTSYQRVQFPQHWLAGVLLTIVFAVLELLGILHPIRGVLEKLTQPLLISSAQVTQVVSLPFRVVTQSFVRYQQVQDLELRYAEALAQLSEKEQLRVENEELRKILGSNNGIAARQPIIAAIISYGEPSLSAGKSEGVNPGDAVLVAQTLVGRIRQTSDHQAEVELFSATNSPVVLGKTESGATGVITGDGRRVLLKEVPIEVDVNVGERVTSVGQPGIEPGLFIGKVQAVEKQQGSPTQVVVIDQIVSFYFSHLVEVRKQ